MSAPPLLEKTNEAHESGKDSRLLPHHVEYLAARAVGTELATRAGLRSVDAREAGRLLGFDGAATSGGLAVPYFDEEGRILTHRVRLEPGEWRTPQGSARPYLPPPGVVPEEVWRTTTPLAVVEAPVKALALCQVGVPTWALGGVTAGGHDTCERGPLGHTLSHPDLQRRMLLDGRSITVVFDAGRVLNPMVALGEAYLAKVLAAKGVEVRIAELPLSGDGTDQGPDDFIAQHGLAPFTAILTRAVPWAPEMLVTQAIELGSTRLEGRRAVAALLESLPFLAALHNDPIARDLAAEELKRAGFRTATLADALSRFKNALSARAAKSAGVEPPKPAESRYQVVDGSLVRVVARGRAEILETIANFTATIEAEVVVSDGVQDARQYEVRARQGKRVVTFRTAATEFPKLTWVSRHLGATAIIEPGRRNADHLPVAIQKLSPPPKQRTVFAHLGWRTIDGEPHFVHCGGATGAHGHRADFEVDVLDGLSNYRLPETPSGAELIAAIRASLSLLDVAPARVSAPLLAATYAPVVGVTALVDHGYFFAGPTGAGKTEVASIGQQHYGAGLDAKNLPASWSSTANALEALAFAAKDALLVIDDFCPRGPRSEVDRLHAVADRLFRAQGNRSGRSRMRSDGSMQPTRPPRGMTLATGEDVPEGHSLRARLLIVEVGRGDVDWAHLTTLQGAAHAGQLAQALAAFVQWLASDLPASQARAAARMEELSHEVQASHRRSPRAVGAAASSLELLLDFASSIGAIGPDERDALWTKCWSGLMELAANQSAYLADADPAARYLTLIRTALRSGNAHLTTEGGGPPARSSNWGWLQSLAKGPRIGVLRADDIYLDPGAALAVAIRQGSAHGVNFPFSMRTINSLLREKGLLASDGGQRGATVRVMLDGNRATVLHLKVQTLLEGEDDVSPLGQFGQFPDPEEAP